MAQRIGLFVLLGSMLASIAGCPAPSNNPPAEYYGEWVNVDLEEAGITRLIIERPPEGVTVHAYGLCHPDDCDWGTVEANYWPNSDDLTCNYETGAASRFLTISLLEWQDPDCLFVHVETDFVDEGREDMVSTDYFHKAS